MLRALTQSNEPVYSWEGRKGVTYYCPHCKSPLIFKDGSIKIKHFAHKTKTSCLYSENESKEHLLMKERIYKMIKVQYPGLSIELEKKLIQNRRADIVLQGKKQIVVVECQVSPITIAEIIERTEDYNRLGYYVLWIYHLKRLKLTGFNQKINKVRFPADEKLLGEYDSLFAMDDGNIKKVHLVPETECSGRYRFSLIPEPIKFYLHKTVKNYHHYRRTKQTMKLCQLGFPSRERVECYYEINFQKDLDYFERMGSRRKQEHGWLDNHKKRLIEDLSEIVEKVEIKVLKYKDAAESQRFVFLAYSQNGWEGLKKLESKIFRGSNGF